MQHYQVVDVDTDTSTALITLEDLRREEFKRQMVRGAVTAEANRRVQWQELVLDWLELKRSRSNSLKTHANYQKAIIKWQEFLATQRIIDQYGNEQPVEMWEVDHTHVREWQAALRAGGRMESTVNHYLSCVSSFYSFVIREKRMANGVEYDLFMDRLGRNRENPFKAGNLQRGRNGSYDRAAYLTVGEYGQLMDYLEAHNTTVTGARNHALIMTYLHTGWRSTELLRMRWGDVRPSKSQPGSFIFAWRGKGAKHQDDVLPADCYHAIVNYLKLAGRWIPGHEHGLQDDSYVWLPVTQPDMSGLRNGPTLDPNRPISDKSALRVLRQALKAAGIANWERFRVHDLRHTHAHLLLETNHNLAVIQARLHHSSLSTTGIYVKAFHRTDPVDTHTAQFRQLRMTV